MLNGPFFRDPTSSPITGNGLPSLGEEDTADIRGVKLWSVEHTAGFLERMGFAESALAFKREVALFGHSSEYLLSERGLFRKSTVQHYCCCSGKTFCII